MKIRSLGIIVFLATAAHLTAQQAPTPSRGDAKAVLRCTNPASGATWDTPLDLAARRVGPFPARITRRAIDWRDNVHGGRFHYDRTSGRLTVIYPSSTGGFFLTDDCRLITSP